MRTYCDGLWMLQYAVVKMRLFARVLCLEGHEDLASDATAAFHRLVEKVDCAMSLESVDGLMNERRLSKGAKCPLSACGGSESHST